MSFFVDANIIVYSAVDGPKRAACERILGAVARRQAEGRISTACLEEVWHLELTRKGGFAPGLTKRVYQLFRPLLPVTDAAIARALGLDAPRLGTMDRVHVATCLEHDVASICSVDTGFDRITGIRRIDPLDEGAVQALLEPPA